MTNLPPKLQDKDELSKFGVALCREIDHSESGKGTLPRRWEKNEQLYNIDPDATNLNVVDGLAPYPIPLWKPKADRITGTVYKAITGIEPYVQCIADDGSNEKADDVERALQMLAAGRNSRENFDRSFKQCLKIAVNTNVSILYVYPTTEDAPEGVKVGDICFAASHPKDTCIYPHEAGSIKDAITVGHKLKPMTAGDIRAKYRDGEYLSDMVVSSSQNNQNEAGKTQAFGRTTDTPASIPDDALVERWQLITRRDLGDGKQDYICIIAKDTQALLKIEPYPYARRCYFDLRFDDEYGSFWPASSPGQDIQGLQLIYSDALNTIIHGSYACAFPLMYIIGGTMDAKVKRYEAGTLLELPSNVSVGTIDNKFNGGGLMAVLPVVSDLADSTTRISRLGTGQNMPAGTTATAAQGFLTAQEEGKDQYTDAVAPFVADVWDFLKELALVHFADFQARYGTSWPLQDVEALTIPMRMEPSGKTNTSSPQVLIQKLQMLLQMAQQPMSKLDYQAVETQVVKALDLPLTESSLEKQGPTAADLAAAVVAVQQGVMAPEQLLEVAMQVLEANGITEQGGPGGAAGAGQPPNGVPGELPGPYGQ